MNSGSNENTQYDRIPSELKNCNQWIIWKIVQKDGATKKVPVSPLSGLPANVQDKTQWVSFEQANACCKRYGCHGIGFVFTEDDPFCGIDLDKCRNPETGEIEGGAMSVIKQMNSYTELSQSGTGVHILIKGKRPGPRNRKDGVEIYDDKRYFITTGDHLEGSPTGVEERQDELDALYTQVFGPDKVATAKDNAATERGTNLSDEDAIQLAEKSEYAQRFQNLFHEGKWEEEGYPSRSEGDAALLGLLYKTGCDKETAFRLMARSALCRDKWLNRKEYREATWNLVCSGDKSEAPADSCAGGALPDPVNVSDWILKEIEPPDPILEESIDKGCKIVLVASSKSRKTFFALQLAVSLAAGKEKFLRWGIKQSRKVLYINMEIQESSMQKRIKNTLIGLGCDQASLEDRFQLINARRVEVDDDMYMKLVKVAKASGTELIILDPVYKLIQGDENKSEDVKTFLRLVDRICEETGAAVLYIMHIAKGYAGDKQTIDLAIGSNVIARDFDTQISIVEHESPGYFVSEQIARSHAPTEAVTIKWDSEKGVFEEAKDVLPKRKTSKSGKSIVISDGVIEETVVSAMKAAHYGLSMTAFDKMLRSDPRFLLTEDRTREVRNMLLEKGVLEKYQEKKKHGVTYIGLPKDIEKIKVGDAAQRAA